MTQRFQRSEMLIGTNSVQRLKQASVAVFGIGGVGSFAVEALARSGLGHLCLVDHDTIDITNLNRQIHALDSTLGLFKGKVMAERIKSINPQIKVEIYQQFITAETLPAIFNPAWDYVIDAVDTVAAKVALISTCKKHHIPIISAMGAANRLSPLGFEVADISQTHTCPLARAVRKALRKKAITTGVKVVYNPTPSFKPVLASAQPATKQGPPASMIFAPATCGLLIASEVVKDLIS